VVEKSLMSHDVCTIQQRHHKGKSNKYTSRKKRLKIKIIYAYMCVNLKTDTGNSYYKET